MKADLLADLRKRATELSAMANAYGAAGLRKSAVGLEADAKLLLRAVQALDVDADELARRHVEGVR